MEPDLPTTLLKFCRQVAEGLSYLAGKSFVHRDIAARNILLDKELNCKVRLYGARIWWHTTFPINFKLSSYKLSSFHNISQPPPPGTLTPTVDLPPVPSAHH